MLKLPPFGKTVRDVLRDPEQLNAAIGCSAEGATIWICVGSDAWRYAKAETQRGRLCLVLPDDEDPAQLDWSCLIGHGVIILPRDLFDKTAIDPLAYQLLCAGCTSVRFESPAGGLYYTWEVEVAA